MVRDVPPGRADAAGSGTCICVDPDVQDVYDGQEGDYCTTKVCGKCSGQVAD